MRTPKPEASLQAKYPDIAALWSSKNDITAEQVFPNSVTVFVWECSVCSYEWKAKPNAMVMRPGCAQCRGVKLIPGVSTVPVEYKRWTTEDLSLVHKGSKQAVLWTCPDCSHQWEQRISTFTKHFLCPECSLESKSLQTLQPALAAEYSRKNTVPVNRVQAGSAKKVWWECSECFHEWEAHVFSRLKGSGCPKCAVANRVRAIPVTFADVASDLLKSEWSSSNDKKPEDYSQGSGFKAKWECSTCSHEWEATIFDRVSADYGCPKCVNKVSRAEDAICTFLESLNIDFVRSSRKIISPMELDVYVPSAKVGIEFNGVYWHSEKFKVDRLYHQKKFEVAKAAGVQLIQIWEDDWNKRQDIVLNMLKVKLGVSDQKKVFARNTENILLSKFDAETFMEANHIQGFKSGSIYAGLKDKNSGSVVAVMILAKEPRHDNRLNIMRYATSQQVVGGFTKILSHVEKTFTPSSFVTFSDNTISDGNLYYSHGFVADKELPPDYMYVVKGERRHKFGYRLKRFETDPSLKFEPGLTEKELARLNNLLRIWDAGKIRWVKNL